MPLSKSAKKALRQSSARQKRNIVKKEAFKKAEKDFKSAVRAKDFNSAQEKLRILYKLLGKASKTNLIKKNTASRKKSRLAKILNKAKAYK